MPFLPITITQGEHDNDYIRIKITIFKKKTNLTQKQFGMAIGFPENYADVRIAQYETNALTPREALIKELATVLGVSKEILTVPVLSSAK